MEIPRIEIPTAFRQGVGLFFKLASIGFLLLLLHIPLALTQDVLKERRGFRDAAAEEIALRWGKQQLVQGPVLVVPYTYQSKINRKTYATGAATEVQETETSWAEAYFLPENLEVGGVVEPEVRRRGIYGTVVYTARLKFRGEFAPDFAAAGIVAERVDWARARLLFGTSDLTGVRAVGAVASAGGRTAEFDAVPNAMLPFAAAAVNAGEGRRIDFGFEATVQGSRELQVAPMGRKTVVMLESPWAAPSFIGAVLPVERQVEPKGFSARWESVHFSRGFPQAWTDQAVKPAEMRQRIEGAGLGVSFMQPVDTYRLAERAQKYGLLFFVLVFAVFFLFEVTAGLRIHPLQYALVGVGLCLFFLGFLALSEFLAVGLAYTLSAGACTALIAGYAWSFLRTGARTATIGGGLVATYGYLYYVLQSQDFALLAGTFALFAMLAVVMFVTRRINWYAPGAKSPLP